MGAPMYRCPVCLHSSFNSVTGLWQGLMSGASRRLTCPVCDEVLLGLDKLTLHLYSHLDQHTDVNNLSQECTYHIKNTTSDDKTITTDSLQFVSMNEVAIKPANICETNNVPIFHLSLEQLNEEPQTTGELLISADQDIIQDNQSQLNDVHEVTSLQKTNCNPELQCGDCGAMFSTARMLSTHAQLVHASSPQDSEHPYACHLCSRRFKMRGALMVHVRFVHGGARLGRSATRTTNTQARSINVASTSCSSPESLFPSLSELSEQLAASPSQQILETSQVTDVSSTPHQSLLSCDTTTTYSSQENIDDSIIQTTMIDYSNPPDEWQDKTDQWNPEKCIENNTEEWPKQIIQDNPEQDGEIIENTEKNAKSTKINDNKAYECEVCLKRFTTKYFHKKHQRLHTGERPYACTTCGKSFAFQQSFHKHLLYHTSAKPHTCSECGQAFKELSTLHNHQRIHTGERPFVCETCGKAFRQRVSYLVHRRIHTGVLPYKCSACNKSFRYKVSQRTHKCQSQPPGHVIRQSELVQRLLMKAASSGPSLDTNQETQPVLQEEDKMTKPIIYTESRNSNFPPLLTINEESLHQLLSIFPN